MQDEEIRHILQTCVAAEMSYLDEKTMPGYEHTPSKKFQKKMKRLFWSERYFGEHIKVGYAVRWAAMVAVTVVSLVAVNEVSARVIGISPWDYVMSYIEKGGMEMRRFQSPVKSEDVSEMDMVTKMYPDNVLEGYEQTEYIEEENGDLISVRWYLKDQEILYSHIGISDGLTEMTDGEYDSKEKTTVHGYDAEYCVKDNQMWLHWIDKQYTHFLSVTDVPDGKNLLESMAENLYEK